MRCPRALAVEVKHLNPHYDHSSHGYRCSSNPICSSYVQTWARRPQHSAAAAVVQIGSELLAKMTKAKPDNWLHDELRIILIRRASLVCDGDISRRMMMTTEQCQASDSRHYWLA
jgi:hypothetical protein